MGRRISHPVNLVPAARRCCAASHRLIAEETLPHVPELITYFDGEIDGVSYELLGVALLPVVKQQAADIEALKQAVRDLGGNI